MTFEELLVDFRNAGGTAENVRLGLGRVGRGLYPIDPTKPSKVFTPRSLMVPVHAIELHDDALHVKPGVVSADAARIFMLAQLHFGWSAGGREQIWELQTQWHTLAPALVTDIEALGVIDKSGRRFAAPSADVCVADYLQARHFGANISSVAPVVDLVNHSRDAEGYMSEGGFGVSGTFANEMHVRYNFSDAIALMLAYGFTQVTHFAFSVGITISLANGLTLSVKRDHNECESRAGVAFPKVVRDGNVVHVSHVKLGSLTTPDLPRSIFRSAMSHLIDQAGADSVFDMIAQFNRTRFIHLLRALRTFDGPLVRALEQACLNQLETMAACVGARWDGHSSTRRC